ncbi:hypothetical protein BKA69DRAFT_1037669 [Paraphysoderma sedebokerense]|nr:hypothetical protein BKA69DRAFT_1037669 [Paraphysoderma sedebokerense]
MGAHSNGNRTQPLSGQLKNASPASGETSTSLVSTPPSPSSDEKHTETEVKKNGQQHVRPRYSDVILAAILSHPLKQIPTSDIYSYILSHFPSFVTASKNWKNQIRYTLTINKLFLKVIPETSKTIGERVIEKERRTRCCWTIDENLLTQFLEDGKVSILCDKIAVTTQSELQVPQDGKSGSDAGSRKRKASDEIEGVKRRKTTQELEFCSISDHTTLKISSNTLQQPNNLSTLSKSIPSNPPNDHLLSDSSINTTSPLQNPSLLTLPPSLSASTNSLQSLITDPSVNASMIASTPITTSLSLPNLNLSFQNADLHPPSETVSALLPNSLDFNFDTSPLAIPANSFAGSQLSDINIDTPTFAAFFDSPSFSSLPDISQSSSSISLTMLPHSDSVSSLPSLPEIQFTTSLPSTNANQIEISNLASTTPPTSTSQFDAFCQQFLQSYDLFCIPPSFNNSKEKKEQILRMLGNMLVSE